MIISRLLVQEILQAYCRGVVHRMRKYLKLRLLQCAEGCCILAALQGLHWQQNARGQQDVAWRNIDGSSMTHDGAALDTQRGLPMLVHGINIHLRAKLLNKPSTSSRRHSSRMMCIHAQAMAFSNLLALPIADHLIIAKEAHALQVLLCSPRQGGMQRLEKGSSTATGA